MEAAANDSFAYNTTVESESATTEKMSIVMIILLCLLLLMLIVISVLFLKMFWYAMEPVHIFIFNFIATLGSTLIAPLLNNFLHLIQTAEICPQNVFSLFVQVAHYVSIILLQIGQQSIRI